MNGKSLRIAEVDESANGEGEGVYREEGPVLHRLPGVLFDVGQTVCQLAIILLRHESRAMSKTNPISFRLRLATSYSR